MADALASIVSGVIGGLIVAGGTVYTSLLKSRTDRDRELLDQACRTALADFSADKEHASPTDEILPLSTYIFFHYHFFKLLESGKVSEETVSRLKVKGESLAGILNESIWRDYVTKKSKIVRS